MIKKINACLALITAAVFPVHCITMIGLLTGILPFQSWFLIVAWALLYCMAAHAAISVIIFFFANEGTDVLRYWKKNIGTIVQRASAIAVIALIHLHVMSTFFSKDGCKLSERPEMIPAALLQLLFMFLAMVHISLSVPKALITLGFLKSALSQKIAWILMLVLCGLLFASALIGTGVYCL